MGWILIFNNKTFDNKNLPQREGSIQDVQLLKNTFYNFKYRVKIVEDPTVQGIRDNMRSLLNEDLSTALCLIVVVMSHGGENDTIYDKAGEPYNLVKEIINSKVFKKFESLPKVVITQACKWESEVSPYTQSENPETVMLRLDSTFERQRSIRYINGSPFIAELCKHLSTHGHIYDFEKIADKVIETFRSTYLIEEQNPTKTVCGGFPSFCPGERGLN